MSLTLTLERGGGEVSGSGTNIELDGTIADGAIKSVEMYGDTEQQTYSGKNLLNITKGTFTQNGITFTQNPDGSVTMNGTSTGNAYYEMNNTTASQTTITSGVRYTLSVGNTPLPSGQVVIQLRKVNPNTIYAAVTDKSASFTAPETTTTFTYIGVYGSGVTLNNVTIYPMLELGSSMTSFEPYVGGTASPNPDYPQEVQTVTGEQTITISDGNGQSQSYTVDLGDIELCKIGTYQDYIYKSGEDWYVHKETWNYTFDGSSDEQWIRSGQSTPTNFIAGMVNLQDFAMIGGDADSGYCNYFDFSIYLDDNKVILSGYQSGGYRFLLYRFPSGSTVTDLASFTTWLGNHPLKMVLVLSTPTDTQITDSALIAQLEALNAGETYDGTTIITVASENLAGPLEVTAAASIAKTYTEVEIGSPFTITDVEGKSSNTTLDGNVYVDWAYNKKQYSFDLFNLTPQDYADIRAFYDYQFNNSAFPTITVPELNIDKLPVYMEISSRNIINQCLLTDKLTIKFRETVQP